jgi:hypothetical protein
MPDAEVALGEMTRIEQDAEGVTLNIAMPRVCARYAIVRGGASTVRTQLKMLLDDLDFDGTGWSSTYSGQRTRSAKRPR